MTRVRASKSHSMTVKGNQRASSSKGRRGFLRVLTTGGYSFVDPPMGEPRRRRPRRRRYVLASGGFDLLERPPND